MTQRETQRETKSSDDMDVRESAAKFDRIRKAHQSEVAEDYVELIADLIDENVRSVLGYGKANEFTLYFQ